MERQGNQIFFTAEEHSRFGVAEVTSLDSAIETADGFIAATDNMDLRTNTLDDSTNSHQVAERRRLILRAGEMRVFARNILVLCADRVMERDLSQNSPEGNN